METWMLSLFGPVTISCGTEKFNDFPPTAACLLAYLAYSIDRLPQSRESIAKVIWPNPEDYSGDPPLRKHLHILRRRLEKFAASDAIIQEDSVPGSNILYLDSKRVDSDLRLLERQFHIASETEAPSVRVHTLSKAIPSRPFLEGFEEAKNQVFDTPWIREARTFAEGLQLNAFDLLWHGYFELREYRSALDIAYKLIHISSFSTEGYVKACVCHAVLGEETQVKENWKKLLEIEEEHHEGSIPEQKLSHFSQTKDRLFRLVKQHQRDTGTNELEYILRRLEDTYDTLDGARGKSFHDIHDPTAQDKAAPSKEAPSVNDIVRPGVSGRSDVMQHNVPPDLTPLIGREKELDEIDSLLAERRLVSVVGLGGSGKTRLITKVAESVSRRFTSTRFINLEVLQEGSSILQYVALAVGLGGEVSYTESSIAEIIGQRNLLLVLDNCEHVLENCRLLVDSLLVRCPKIKILTSSREPLKCRGEAIYAVPPLSVPGDLSAPTLADLSGYGATELFLGRLPRPLSISNDDALWIIRICRRLDGHALAIELAAAWVQSLTPQEIASDLDGRFDLLNAGHNSQPKRHQTLRTVLQGSYKILRSERRRLLSYLSVFRDGFTPEAVKAVYNRQDTTDLHLKQMLQELIDLSLLTKTDIGGRSRYRLQEMIRQYGQEILQAGYPWDIIPPDLPLDPVEEGLASSHDYLTVGHAHVAYYLKLAQEQDTKHKGPLQKEVLIVLEREKNNMRAALDFALVNSSGETLLCLVDALLRFWWTQGYFAEGRDYAERALRRTENDPPCPAHAMVLNGAGTLAEMQGEYDTAIGWLNQAVAMAEKNEYSRALSSAKGNLGDIAHVRGEYAQAELLLTESLKIVQAREDTWHEVLLRGSLGHVAYDKGDLETAFEHLRVAKNLIDMEELQLPKVKVCTYLGQAYAARGEIREAYKLYQEALSQYQVGERGGRAIAFTLLCLAQLLIEQGKFDEAQQYLANSLVMCRDFAYLYCLVLTLDTVASLIAFQKIPNASLTDSVSICRAATCLRYETKLALAPRQQALHDECLSELRRKLGVSTGIEIVPNSKKIWQEGTALALRLLQ